MITTKQDFTRVRGDSYPISLMFNKSATEPLDLTGATVTMKVKMSTLTSFNATITAPLTGKAEFLFTTSSFTTAGTFSYEVELLTATGVLYTVLAGSLTIIEDLG